MGRALGGPGNAQAEPGLGFPGEGVVGGGAVGSGAFGDIVSSLWAPGITHGGSGSRVLGEGGNGGPLPGDSKQISAG